jgi:uncharacterized protein
MAEAVPGPAMTHDLAEVAARFGAELRRAGLPVGPGRSERFAGAVTIARPETLDALYRCALATLVSGRDEIDILRAVFNHVFGGLNDPAGRRGDQSPAPAVRPSGTPEDLLAKAARAAKTHVSDGPQADTPDASEADADSPEPEREVEHRYLGSTVERLAGKDFAELSESELLLLAGLMRSITLAVPLRRSRRQHRRPGGPRTDMRSTLRQARRTGGYAFRLISRAPSRRPRRLVVLCDISGSMEPYARAMIQLLYCAAGGARAEVFTFATRLTRLTPALARTLPGLALQRAGEAAPDWLGGTRIGASLKEFNDIYGRRGMARGAVVVIISDGWDTGDPDVLRREMERLSLVAFRIVWVNPRTKSASYQPLAGGMAAAWPHCDAVVSAHTLAALEQLADALADPVRRRAPVRSRWPALPEPPRLACPFRIPQRGGMRVSSPCGAGPWDRQRPRGLRGLRLTERPPNTQAPSSVSTGESGFSDSSLSPATSRPPRTATPESITRISGGTVMDIPPNTEKALIVISRPGRIASRRSMSAPPNTVATVLLAGTRQVPFRDAPPNTAMIRPSRRATGAPWRDAGTGDTEPAAEGRSSISGTSSAWVFAE